MKANSRFLIFFAFLSSLIFAAGTFTLPVLTETSRSKAAAIYDRDCYACHRWTRDFAGPSMLGNVSRYKENPKALFNYLKDPKPIHPDKYRPMEIEKLSDGDASLMVAWLFALLEDSTAKDRPR
ncbi:MAG: cytochrome c [Fibrobacteraceae bacterium]|nr:cytochrome c [Fibrobacteraceae bacterium]